MVGQSFRFVSFVGKVLQILFFDYLNKVKFVNVLNYILTFIYKKINMFRQQNKYKYLNINYCYNLKRITITINNNILS